MHVDNSCRGTQSISEQNGKACDAFLTLRCFSLHLNNWRLHLVWRPTISLVWFSSNNLQVQPLRECLDKTNCTKHLHLRTAAPWRWYFPSGAGWDWKTMNRRIEGVCVLHYHLVTGDKHHSRLTLLLLCVQIWKGITLVCGVFSLADYTWKEHSGIFN